MTDRVKRLKKRQSEVKPCMSSERARLVTEAYNMYAGEPGILLKAHALEYILKNMKIYIQDDELIVGNHTDKPRCAPVYPEFAVDFIEDELDIFETRKVDPLQISPEDKEELRNILPKWRNRALNVAVRESIPADTQHLVDLNYISIGSTDTGTGELLPDYKRLMSKGLLDIKAQCIKNIEDTPIINRENEEKREFWQASIIVIDAAIDFALRFSKEAEMLAETEKDAKRKAELKRISENCKNVPANRPRNFWEAVQFVWFMHLIITIESNGHGNSFGRFDQYMEEFYDSDNEIDEDSAAELLECLFIKVTDILKVRNAFFSASYAGYPIWQNMTIGGQNEKGEDVCNTMTHICLKANAEVQTSQPSMSLRYFDGMNKDILNEAVTMIQSGMATPAFFNDKLIIPNLLDRGFSKDDAMNYSIHGCVQSSAPGKTDERLSVGFCNVLKILELTMNNGIDKETGEQIGVKSCKFEEFKSLDDFMNVIFENMDIFVSRMVDGHNRACAIQETMMEMPFASVMVDGCVQSGKSIQSGGAIYSEASGFLCGIACVADSLAAIGKLVFEEKKITLKELKEAIDCDFEGKEDLRQMLLNKAPKYGNNDDYVDSLGAKVVEHYRKSMEKNFDTRGGKITFVIESQSFNVVQGRAVGATPDGRHAHDPLNDNASPYMGRDINGPTANVLSVAKLNQRNALMGCLYNLRFDPRSIAGEKGKQVIAGVIKTYFQKLGEHIQINVVDNATLLDAQVHPELHRDLLVRVAGYLAYFTELDKEVQDVIIARTAHTC